MHHSVCICMCLMVLSRSFDDIADRVWLISCVYRTTNEIGRRLKYCWIVTRSHCQNNFGHCLRNRSKDDVSSSGQLTDETAGHRPASPDERAPNFELPSSSATKTITRHRYRNIAQRDKQFSMTNNSYYLSAIVKAAATHTIYQC